ncbi:alpha/beta hydrolase family protein [Flavobacterium daejeonense]|uniref:alpha/beta hydrolase family protein n=1 Tax=Flavobacterium daejeonense TaxID=350893 RepID=UPI000479B792|nr:alpha/beta fold hydrolase [Flavobacterium daejeonense]
MKTILTILFATLLSFSVKAQEITGQWNGVLNVQGMQLRLVFHITKTTDSFTATMDSPDQKANGIPVTKTTFEKPKIKFEIAAINMEYNGELKEQEIIGVFTQNGQQFPLNLSRNTIEKTALKRPQEPAKLFPYYEEEVTFLNPKANISLAGTLTLPKKEGVYPAVILISGSGPQNRDEELMGHKPFLVISDFLSRNGIAVLRYDDRGFGNSKGDFKSATTADFATDVESALAYLKTRKEINTNQIGLIGHSEGGVIAPIVASKSKDVNFIILLAGTGIPGNELLLLQQEKIAHVSGISDAEIQKATANNKTLFDLIVHSTDNEKLKSDLRAELNQIIDNDTAAKIPNGITKEKYIDEKLNQLISPWMLYFIKSNPATVLEKVKCPVLALNGEKDTQVPYKENLTAIKNALAKGGNKKLTVKSFPNLNHLFQECKTGSPEEYATIEQTFAPVVLEEMLQWIKTQTK